MNSIAVVGAFDRYNFGDLLFPRILESWAAKNLPGLEFEYFSTTAVDLTHLGGVETKAMTELPVREPRAVILAGGQLLNATWATMHLNVVPAEQHRFLKFFYRALGRNLADVYARASLSGRTDFPWVIPSSFVHDVPIAYNAVGATHFSRWSDSKLTRLAEHLSDARYITVRDPETQRQLNSFGMGSIDLSPDSAVLASALLNVNECEIGNSIIEDHSYICFQVGRGYSVGNVRTIARQLEAVARETGLAIVLLPIGTATGHEDHVPLRHIQAHLRERGIEAVLVNRPTVASTLGVISKARLFIGTSLHGCLTSFSFGIPSVGYSRVSKQVHSMQYVAGGCEWHSITNFSDIVGAASLGLSSSRQRILASRDAAQSAANANFTALFSAILS